MRTLRTTFLPLTACLALPLHAQTPCSVQGTISLWSGEGNVLDGVGGHDGVLVNGVTYGPGVAGQALVLDGSSWVSVPNSPDWNFGAADFSIEFWVMLNRIDTGYGLIGHDDGGGSNNKWMLVRNGVGPDDLTLHTNTTGYSPTYFTAPWFATAHTWDHVVLTRSGTVLSFYIDGVLVGVEASSLAIPSASNPLTIGNPGEGPNGLDGGLDEVAIYNRALSPAEVALHYLARGSRCVTQAVPLPAGHIYLALQPTQAQPSTVLEFDDSGALTSTHDLSASLPAGSVIPNWNAIRPCEVTPWQTLLCTTSYSPRGGWFEMDATGSIVMFYPDSGGAPGDYSGAAGATIAACGTVVGAHYAPSGTAQLRALSPQGTPLWSVTADEALSPAVVGSTIYVGRFQVNPISEWSLLGAPIGSIGSYRHVFTTKRLPNNRLLIGDLQVDGGPVVWIVRDLLSGFEVVLPMASYPSPNDSADVDAAGNVWVLCGTTLVRFDPTLAIATGTIVLATPGPTEPYGLAVSGVPLGVMASASAFGTGCGSPALTIAPVVNALPTINATAQASLTNIPSSLAFVALGWSSSLMGPFPLPLPMANWGMPGCDLLQSCEIIAASVTSTGPSTANFSLPVPNWGGLAGLHVYVQGWAYAPGFNSGARVVSNGIDWGIGL